MLGIPSVETRENETISLHHQNWWDKSRDDWYGPMELDFDGDRLLQEIYLMIEKLQKERRILPSSSLKISAEEKSLSKNLGSISSLISYRK
ncbi:hypothetical protein Tco_0685206 [Tanacetum coccineum]